MLDILLNDMLECGKKLKLRYMQYLLFPSNVYYIEFLCYMVIVFILNGLLLFLLLLLVLSTSVQFEALVFNYSYNFVHVY